jgi:hypothetical protein
LSFSYLKAEIDLPHPGVSNEDEVVGLAVETVVPKAALGVTVPKRIF